MSNENGGPLHGGFLTAARVLVTGAASGIGLAVVARCLSEGATVAALDLDGPALGRAVAGLAAGGGDRVTGVQADVADPDQVRAAVATAGELLGRLTAVVNVAGIGGYTGDIGQISPAEWARTLAVNLSGTFHVCRAALPFLRASGTGLRASGTGLRASGTGRRASGNGRIVNVSSQYGLVGGAGSPAYSAAKAGVIGLTRAMAVDHAAEGILVNCVCPGPIDTPMLRASTRHGELAGREAARTAGRVLLGGPGGPEDVAGVIAFLLGPDAGFLTGAVLTCDGGWTAG
jgi:NAD(P)-dependent dehydrogenase (short-subunit alcohol dehydrogenase family)